MIGINRVQESSKLPLTQMMDFGNRKTHRGACLLDPDHLRMSLLRFYRVGKATRTVGGLEPHSLSLYVYFTLCIMGTTCYVHYVVRKTAFSLAKNFLESCGFILFRFSQSDH